MTAFAVALTVALVVSLWTMPVVLRYAHRKGLLDPATERKNHSVEVPRLGGVGILAGFIAGVAAAFFAPRPGGWWTVNTTAILVGALMMFAVGLADDLLHDRKSGREGLSPPVKLALQFLAAAIPVVTALRVHGGVLIRGFEIFGEGYVSLHPWIAVPLTLIWIVGIANAFNFIDGLDGLCGGVALIVDLTIAVIALGGPRLAPSEAVLALATAGGIIGFLRLNFPPARIFMGDGGALMLGYLLSALAVSSVAKSQTLIALGVPLLILALPLFNLTQVVVGRVLRGDSPMQADRTHLHDRLQDAGWSPYSAVLFIYAICGLCSAAALGLSNLAKEAAILAIVVAGLLVVVAIRRPRDHDAEDPDEATPPPPH